MIRGLLLLILTPLCLFGRQSALFYPAHGGRTGDKLIHFTKALWASHKSGLPLYITPFSYSDYLDLYYTQPHYTPGMESGFDQQLTIKSIGAINSSTREDYWMQVGFFFKPARWKHYEVGTWREMLEDEKFREMLRQKIRLVRPFDYAPPQERGITVALHVRAGGGCDEPLYSHQYFDYKAAQIPTIDRRRMCPKMGVAEQNFPHKFPPLQYYLDALKTLSERLGDPPLYVYLFTDSKAPFEIIDGIERRLEKSNITFDCHNSPSGPATLVLEDMIAMSRFDVLIRGGSNYPQISHLIGRHKLVIYPMGHFWYRNCLIMNPIELHFDRANLPRDDRHDNIWSRFQLQ